MFQHCMKKGRLSKKTVDETIAGMVVQIRRRIHLHDIAHITDHHSVGNRHGFTLVMGNEDDGEPEFTLEFLDFKTHAFSQFRIQVG